MTLLEHARRRAQRNIRAEQILFSLNRAHEDFYLRALLDCPSQRVVQPRNRGTTAAILSSLLLIAHREHNASVAVFPSDHYYSDENVITEAVESAFELSRREPESVILIGGKPYGPEVEYGWVEVGAPVHGRPDSFRVRNFYEKPSLPLARFLFEQGSLWNTFVMVGTALAFLEMICSALPGMLKQFERFPVLQAPNQELRIPDTLYAPIPISDFSRQVLSMETQRLIVQRLDSVTWSDLGDCDRAVAALAPSGRVPEWVTRWRAAKPPASAVGPDRLAARA
jgi:mannose-1-phosphate guanylyltransferase